MSTGAYVLVKFEGPERLMPAVEELDGRADIAKWDAVDGHFDLVLKVKDKGASAIEQIKKLGGFAELASCELQSDNENELTLSPDYSYSYVFIETERYQQKAVQSSLEKMDAVTFCSPATGACDLVAIVRGESFDKIARTVNNDIRPLDGVLRLKQDRIIFLDRM